MEHSCSAKYLPQDQAITAAQTAINQNPINKPAVAVASGSMAVLPPEHLALLTSRYWSNKGVKLSVGFMEPIQDDLANRILSHFNAWSEWANVEFHRTKTDPQIRVSRGEGGYYSYLGTDILHIPKDQQTMNLEAFTMQTPDSEFHRVVRHEIGHTMGLVHEHLRKELVARLDSQKTIAYFQQTQGWSPSMTTEQVLTPLDDAQLTETPTADEMSIMTYQLPGIITKDGKPIIGGTDIDEIDKAFIAKIYPKAITPPPPPKPPVSTALKIIEIFASYEGYKTVEGPDPGALLSVLPK